MYTFYIIVRVFLGWGGGLSEITHTEDNFIFFKKMFIKYQNEILQLYSHTRKLSSWVSFWIPISGLIDTDVLVPKVFHHKESLPEEKKGRKSGM